MLSDHSSESSDTPVLEPVRLEAVAGTFYPRDAADLQDEVALFLNQVPAEELPGEVLALIVPHAGYAFSGATAGAAYRHIREGAYDTVVILAPSHREGFAGASVYAGGSYHTPLGYVPVDMALAGALVSAGGDLIFEGQEGHRVSPGIPGVGGEHAIEVHLPFLQQTLSAFQVVPIVVGSYTPASCQRIANVLARALRNRRVLLVASSDLYHGHSDVACVASDVETLARIERMDVDGLVQGLADGTCQACGAGPILIALMAAGQMGATRAQLLARTNSNAVTGQAAGYVVGYGAVAILGSG